MRALKAEFASPSPRDDIVINSCDKNFFPRNYLFSNFHFNWRYKISDFSLLFLLFTRQYGTGDQIASKKIALSLLTHRCLGVICLETDHWNIKIKRSYITWTFSKKECMNSSTLSWLWFGQVLVQQGQLDIWADNVLLKFSFTEPFV